MDQKKHWGPGIPEYSKEDMLTPEEVYSNCLNLACMALHSWGYRITRILPYLRHFPNIIAEKEGEEWHIAMVPALLPDRAWLSRVKRWGFISFSGQARKRVAWMPVEIGSKDNQRAEAGLGLRGDEYYVSIPDLFEITRDPLPEPGSEDYPLLGLHLLGRAFEENDMERLEGMLHEVCCYRTFNMTEPILGREAVMAHFRSLVENRKETGFRIYSEVIHIVGRLPVDQEMHLIMMLEMLNHTTWQSKYDPNKLGLMLFVSFSEIGYFGLMKAEFDPQGMIRELSLEDISNYRFLEVDEEEARQRIMSEEQRKASEGRMGESP